MSKTKSNESEWLVYIILASDHSLYTGITTDIYRRWLQHCGQKTGGARYFRGRKPIALVYLESGHTHSTASKREIYIKKMSKIEKHNFLKEKDWADMNLTNNLGQNNTDLR